MLITDSLCGNMKHELIREPYENTPFGVRKWTDNFSHGA